MSKAPFYIARLTAAERFALIQAVRIGLEDGSLELWGEAAKSASAKLEASLAGRK